MARRRKYFDQSLVLKAKNEIKKFKYGRTYIRLLAIIKAGEYYIKDVAKMLDVERNAVERWIRRFKEQGIEGIIDKPKGHYPSKLNEEHKRIIYKWLRTSKDAQGKPVHWTLEKLKLSIEEELGIKISTTPLWKHIRKLGYKQKVPRPVHVKAKEGEQNKFKKKLTRRYKNL